MKSLWKIYAFRVILLSGLKQRVNFEVFRSWRLITKPKSDFVGWRERFNEMKIKPRILIVDDEPQIARVLKISLAARGYNIRVASNGLSALEIFDEWRPDLVITDLSMPNMDGLKLCRKIRAESKIPVIVLSAESKKHVKFEALDAGADDYLTKPFEINELLERIRALLSAAKENEIINAWNPFELLSRSLNHWRIFTNNL